MSRPRSKPASLREQTARLCALVIREDANDPLDTKTDSCNLAIEVLDDLFIEALIPMGETSNATHRDIDSLHMISVDRCRDLERAIRDIIPDKADWLKRARTAYVRKGINWQSDVRQARKELIG